jgi:hypothetical protein
LRFRNGSLAARAPGRHEGYNPTVASLVPFGYRLLVSLPHPLAEIWILWLIVVLFEIHYLLRRRDRTRQLSQSGELMNFREIKAVGCVAGFILLTFITAFCTYLVMRTKGLL